MSEPKFGEWQKGPPPEGYGPALNYRRDSAYWADMAVMPDGNYATHWMPLPPPPKEDWEEAWEKYSTRNNDMALSLPEGYGFPKHAFKAGFEAGRKP